VIEATFTIQIPDLEAVRDQVFREAARLINEACIHSRPVVEARARVLVRSLIRASEGYRALTAPDDRARGEVGVFRSQVDEIVEAIVQATVVKLTPVRAAASTFSGGILIDQSLVSRAASFTSEQGHPVHWLQWLLTAGRQFVVAGYRFEPARRKRKGRTGLGVMLKSKSGANWQTPDELGAATTESNFLTDALAGLEKPLGQLLDEELTKRLS
jgi:hypothetical protein